MRSFIVYRVTNLVTLKAYIGITTQRLDRRWRAHCRGNGDPTWKSAIHRAIKKYGENVFSVEHVASASSEGDLLELERLIIAQERTLAPHGYNLVSGGDGVLSPSDETRKRMAAAKAGWTPSAELRRIASERLKGKTLSPEHRAKISASKLGVRRTPEQRAKMSAAQRRKAPPTAETREKLSAAGVGRVFSQETRAKIAAAARRRRWTPEQRAKLSAAHLGKPWTDAQRAARRK